MKAPANRERWEILGGLFVLLKVLTTAVSLMHPTSSCKYPVLMYCQVMYYLTGALKIIFIPWLLYLTFLPHRCAQWNELGMALFYTRQILAIMIYWKGEHLVSSVIRKEGNLVIWETEKKFSSISCSVSWDTQCFISHTALQIR